MMNNIRPPVSYIAVFNQEAVKHCLLQHQSCQGSMVMLISYQPILKKTI